MTLRLTLTRHAKSSWDNSNQPDHERPLNARGRKGATALGAWMETRGYAPDLILCSTAQRTLETCELMLAELSGKPQVENVKELYHASANQLHAVLSLYQAEDVLIIGHNPGIAEFAANLAHTPPPNERFASYPTGATTVFDFVEEAWADIGLQLGAVRDFVVPEELGVD